jgi:hypothetical protein
LYNELQSATKDVIVFCHQPLSEMDTDQFTLTKEIYHTQNRADVRRILEQSGKVVAVIHGHVHKHRVDVIKGIPYITCANLTNDNSFGELPVTANGSWELLEFDRSSRVIKLIRESYISSAYHTIYESYIPFGRTSISDDVSEHPEEVFKQGYSSAFGRAAFLRDATQLNVIDDDYLYKFPVNIYTPDDTTLRGAIRINGRTDSPNFGRAHWIYTNTGEKFIFEGWVMMGDQKFKAIKLGGKDTTSTPRVYITFQADGLIYVATATSTLTSIGSYSLGTWYKIELFIEPATGLYAGNIGGINLPACSFYTSGSDSKFREMEIVTESGDLWIHSFSVKPWFSPRPEMDGFAVEETNP